jgi:hypothetical protein
MRLNVHLLSFIGLLAGILILFQALRLYLNPSISIEWSTASEFEVAGFNIFRAENANGPFVKINETLISPSDDPLTGGDYVYVDTNVESGARYYYQLQEIEHSGTVAAHGPIDAKATRGGIAEAILAGVLLIGSFMILVQNRRRE